MYFSNRVEAGQKLAQRLMHVALEHPVVIGLPRGGVPVAAQVARALAAPLDICIVRKIGAPWFPELGMGAIAEGGFLHLNSEVISGLGARPRDVDAAVRIEQREVEERVKHLRRGVAPLHVQGRTVILIDDGIATGGTMQAAVLALRARGAGRIVLATPVAATQALEVLQEMVNEIVCLSPASELVAIGAWYEDFTQLDDDEVAALLAQAAQPGAPSGPGAVEREVEIPCEEARLEGTLVIPRGARGLVVFAHGSGSSRHSPRNRHVAEALTREGLGTLLFDLLTRDEEERDETTGALRFDIGLLARRLVGATQWLRHDPSTAALRIGYFGASTGAAAALVAAALLPDDVAAVVSRGGRPDLAFEALPQVRVPTLLLVGGDDVAVLQLNQRAASLMQAPVELVVLPGATHLFEEPGALDEVARLAAGFFGRFLEAGEGVTAPLP
jgi:putative phosphoribosyl transferase